MTLLAPGQWDGLIVLCAANNLDSIKVADLHLAEHLSRLAPVLYVDPPMSHLTPRKHPETGPALRSPRLRLHQPGLARLTPVIQPFSSRPGLSVMSCTLIRRYLRRATARLGGRVTAVISAWPHYPVFGSCDERLSVYWAQDDFVGGAALLGLNTGLLDRQERRVASGADLVVAANPVVATTWKDRGQRTLLIPFGADIDAYRDVERAARPADADLPGPVAGLVGRLNDRTDLGLLESIADRGRSLLLIGPKDPAFEPARFAALQRRRNVRWVGPKEFPALPGYLQVMDVGLVPYRNNPFNRGSFPLKALEYLAAGRAVVSTDLPATRWLATDLISIADGPEPFADEVDRMLAVPRTPGILASRQEFAATHSWAHRAAGIYDAVTRGVQAKSQAPRLSRAAPPSAS
jgi:teichuronic acid biosynthesis glycosyltransferase TuaH